MITEWFKTLPGFGILAGEPAPAPTAEERRKARAMSRSVMIATPVARAPCWQYTVSLCETSMLLQRLGIKFLLQFVVGSSNLPAARNELCARFLASPCTDLMFIDDDMQWRASDVVRLLATTAPIAGGVGRKRVDKPNSDPDVWCGHPDLGADGTLTQGDMGFVRFKKAGTGFLKISREALEQIIAAKPEWKGRGKDTMPEEVREKYYRFFKFADDETEIGEDFDFCNTWAALGGEIWIDPEIVLGHVGEKTYSGAICELMKQAEAS
jgi:hypothetical protein